jgi:DHA2 family multidrug resistance protein
MMRQLGGSFGIAMINTYVAHRFGSHRNDLISNISIYNPQATQRINGLTQYFAGKSGTLIEAQHKAMAVVNNGIDRQSFLMSYLDAYIFVGLLFVLAMPLLLVVLDRKKQAGPVVLVSDH